MNDKKIDILLAVFNGEKYIHQQIESIMNQTYKEFHLWIRDNHSEDRTVEVVQKLIDRYPTQITLLRSPFNVGIIGNFSALIEQSQADYVFFSDADDVWLSQKVEKTIKKMQDLEARYGKQTPLLVHTDLSVVDAHLNMIHPSFWKYSFLKPALPHTLCRQLIQNQITGCTVMINRSLIEIAAPIPREAKMHDWWLGLCIAAFGKLDYLNEPTLLYRQHGKNDTGAKPYNLRLLFKRSISITKEIFVQEKMKSVRQASLFLERYSDRLPPQKKDAIRGFIEFQDATFFKKGYLMFKWRIFRTGILRNLLLLCSNLK